MAKILLKIAAIIMLLHGLWLLVGTFTQTTSVDMPDNVAQFMIGATFCGILLTLLLAGLFWAFSAIKDKTETKYLLIVTTATFFLGIIEIIYFFPYVVSIIPAILAFIALLKLRKVTA